MKNLTLLCAIALIALIVSPVMASDSVQLSNERGTDTEVREYFSGNQKPIAEAQDDSVQLVSTERAHRGYFPKDSATPSSPVQSIDQSRENGN